MSFIFSKVNFKESLYLKFTNILKFKYVKLSVLNLYLASNYRIIGFQPLYQEELTRPGMHG